jgi:hypothetical protein
MYSKDVGFKFLGAGHFSAVFEHSLLPNRVIKVGFKKEDSGAAYAAWCRMNQGRAGVPTIHAIARHAGCYTVVLDKLFEFNSEKDSKKDSEVTHYYELAAASLYGRDTGFWDDFSKNLKNTISDIRSFFVDIASFDLHEGNVMVNSNGDLVITDPVSWTREDTISRTKFHIDTDELLAEVKEVAERVAERP